MTLVAVALDHAPTKKTLASATIQLAFLIKVLSLLFVEHLPIARKRNARAQPSTHSQRWSNPVGIGLAEGPTAPGRAADSRGSCPLRSAADEGGLYASRRDHATEEVNHQVDATRQPWPFCAAFGRVDAREKRQR